MSQKRKAEVELKGDVTRNGLISAREAIAKRTQAQQENHISNNTLTANGATSATEQPTLDYDSEEGMSVDGADDQVYDSLAIDPLPALDISLSTWAADKNNYKLISPRHERVRLSYNQTITVVGQYDLSVHSGAVSVDWAVLTSNSLMQRIIASSSEPLPVIRCISANPAELELRSVPNEQNLEDLARVGPLFDGIWCCKCEPCVINNQSRTFTKLQRSSDYHVRRVAPLIIPTEWQHYLHAISQPENAKDVKRVIAVTGENSSGKPTFLRLLINSLFTASLKSQAKSIYILELDFENPECGLPGHVLLIQQLGPMIRPTWAQRKSENEIIKAFAVGVGSNRVSVEDFVGCAKHLFEIAISALKSSSLGLIIHFPSSSPGSNNAIVKRLGEILSSDELVTIGSSGNQGTSFKIRRGKETHLPAIVRNQFPGVVRTASERRDMILQAYFHMSPPKCTGLRRTPITSWRPQALSYHPENPSFAAVLVGGEMSPMHSNILSRLLNGNLVCLAQLDNALHLNGSVLQGDGDEMPYAGLTALTKRKIISAHSCQVRGMALIRSIDTENKVLWIVTPADISNIRIEKLVLIVGLFQVPGWALTEDYYFRNSVRNNGDKTGNEALIENGEQNPWVEFS